MLPNPRFAPGDRVVYTTRWLWSVGLAPTGAACHYRGIVVDRPDLLGGLDPERFVAVDWQDGGEPMVVNVANIGHVGVRGGARTYDVPIWASINQGRRKTRR